MKYIAITVFAACVAFSGCSVSEDAPHPEDSKRSALAVEVRDAGYAGTRASEEGWRTLFTAGDRVGLYVVRGGAVAADNLCLTLGDDGKWTAQTAEPLYYESGDEYYAYYPWQSDMSGKTDAGAATAEGFFAPLTAGWTPGADQSTHEKYTQWDLMFCTGTVGAVQADGTRPLTLGLMHRMSVAALELPGTKYVTADGFSYATPTVEAAFTFGGAECSPYRADGLYRLLYNPSSPAEIGGSYVWSGTEKTFAFTPDAPAGSYKVYRIEGGLKDGGGSER